MVSVADGGSHAVKVSEDVCGHDFATGIHLIFDTTGHSHFLSSCSFGFNHSIVNLIIALYLNQLIGTIFELGQEVRVVMPDTARFRVIVLNRQISLVCCEHSGKVYMKTGVRQSTRQGYITVQRILEKQAFGKMKIRSVKTSDAKLFLIKLQKEDGRSYSSIHTIRGVLRPAFQMAVDDDILMKNPFGFQLAGVVVNDSVTREAISRDQMRKFLKFVHDDVVYCKYYEAVYILFHTGMRISEFCGLTLRDIDLENRTVNIDHQLIRTADMRYIIEPTKTEAGTRKIPITQDVADMFRAIIEDREVPRQEKLIDGYGGFLFYDENDMPLVAMHWQHRFNHMVGRYNDIYRVQMPNITPHVCRHTYCSNQAKSGMNPKTLQYLMGHSDISVTMNVYTHVGLNDAEEELRRMEEFQKAQAEVEKKNGIKPVSQKMFKAI